MNPRTNRTPVVIALLLLPTLLFQTLSAQTRPATGPRPQPALRVIEAGKLVGEFSHDYATAADTYSGMSFILRGRVNKVNIRKGTDGNTYVTVHIVPRELGNENMIPLYVDFNAKMADEVAKLQKGDLIEITTQYLPIPAGAEIVHEVKGFFGSKFTSVGADPKITKLRDDFVDWIRKNNAVPPGPNDSDNQLVKDMAKKVDASIATGDDFVFLFGAKLLKSGIVTALCVQDGKMLQVDYTAAQIENLKLAPTNILITSVPSDAIRMPIEAEFTMPKVSTTWDLSKHLFGEVPVKVKTFHPEKDGEYGLRMVTYTGKTRTVLYHSFHGRLASATFKLEFVAAPHELAQLNLTRDPSPRLVFFEVVRQVPGVPADPAAKYETLSEPFGMVIEMSNSEAPK